MVNFNILINKKKKIIHNNSVINRILNEFNPDAIMVWGLWNLPRAILSPLEKFETYPIAYYIADYWPSLPDAYTLHWQSPPRNATFRRLKKVLAMFALNSNSQLPDQPKLCLNNAICVSKFVRNHLIQKGNLPDTARVIYNGIDIETFAYNRTIEINKVTTHPLRILYAGRISPEKGVDIAIQAFGRLIRGGIDAILDILGRGISEYITRLRKLCQQEGIADRVRFIDYIARDEMPAFLSSYGILVVPSRWAEPLPRIIQEGMSVGCIVIAADIGGIPEIIEDGVNGLLFSPGDHKDLESKILLMYKNPTLFEQYSFEGRKTVEERFTIKKMVDKIETYLHQIA